MNSSLVHGETKSKCVLSETCIIDTDNWVELWTCLKYTLYTFAVILPMYPSEKRAAAAARKRFTLDPFSDHLIFVQVFRVSLCYHLCMENESLLVCIQSFNVLNNRNNALN